MIFSWSNSEDRRWSVRAGPWTHGMVYDVCNISAGVLTWLVGQQSQFVLKFHIWHQVGFWTVEIIEITTSHQSLDLVVACDRYVQFAGCHMHQVPDPVPSQGSLLRWRCWTQKQLKLVNNRYTQIAKMSVSGPGLLKYWHKLIFRAGADLSKCLLPDLMSAAMGQK